MGIRRLYCNTLINDTSTTTNNNNNINDDNNNINDDNNYNSDNDNNDIDNNNDNYINSINIVLNININYLLLFSETSVSSSYFIILVKCIVSTLSTLFRLSFNVLIFVGHIKSAQYYQQQFNIMINLFQHFILRNDVQSIQKIQYQHYEIHKHLSLDKLLSLSVKTLRYRWQFDVT